MPSTTSTTVVTRPSLDLRRLQLRPSWADKWDTAGTARNPRDQGTNFCSAGQLNNHHISSSSGLTLIRAMNLRFSDERLPHCAIQAPGTDHLRTRQTLAEWTIHGRSSNTLSNLHANNNHSFQMQFTIILETSVQQQQDDESLLRQFQVWTCAMKR